MKRYLAHALSVLCLLNCFSVIDASEDGNNLDEIEVLESSQKRVDPSYLVAGLVVIVGLYHCAKSNPKPEEPGRFLTDILEENLATHGDIDVLSKDKELELIN